jgi:hypothetical protein
MEGVAGAATASIGMLLHALQQAGQDRLRHAACAGAQTAIQVHADWHDWRRHVHVHLLTAWRHEGVRLHLWRSRAGGMLHAWAAGCCLLLLLPQALLPMMMPRLLLLTLLPRTLLPSLPVGSGGMSWAGLQSQQHRSSQGYLQTIQLH